MGLLYLLWSIDRLHVERESYNHKPFITISAIFIPQQHTVLSFKHLWKPCLVDLLEWRHHWNHWNKWPCLLSLQGLLKIRIKCALQLDHINMNADRCDWPWKKHCGSYSTQPLPNRHAMCLTSCSFTLKCTCRIRIEACTLNALLNKKDEWKLLYDIPFRFMELIYLVICSKPCLIIRVDMSRSPILSKNLEMAQ